MVTFHDEPLPLLPDETVGQFLCEQFRTVTQSLLRCFILPFVHPSVASYGWRLWKKRDRELEVRDGKKGEGEEGDDGHGGEKVGNRDGAKRGEAFSHSCCLCSYEPVTYSLLVAIRSLIL